MFCNANIHGNCQSALTILNPEEQMLVKNTAEGLSVKGLSTPVLEH